MGKEPAARKHEGHHEPFWVAWLNFCIALSLSCGGAKALRRSPTWGVSSGRDPASKVWGKYADHRFREERFDRWLCSFARTELACPVLQLCRSCAGSAILCCERRLHE